MAALLRARNEADAVIAGLLRRPAEQGHLGEWLAVRLLELEPAPSAHRCRLGREVRSGPLAGRTVNVKSYGALQGILDLHEDDAATDEYLVLSGTREAAGSSRGALGPLAVAHVHLIEGRPLIADLRSRGIKIGIASSVRRSV
jgi:hypothetical protein